MGVKKCIIDKAGINEVFIGEIGERKSTPKRTLSGNISEGGKGRTKERRKGGGGFTRFGLWREVEGRLEGGGLEERGKFIGFVILYRMEIMKLMMGEG